MDTPLAKLPECNQMFAEFESVSPLRLTNWLGYWRRAVRYGRRRYKFQLLAPLLKSKGVPALPSDISTLYGNAGMLRLEWQGLYTLPNLVALRKMRKAATLRSA